MRAHPTEPLALAMPEDMVEAIAERAATILADRRAGFRGRLAARRRSNRRLHRLPAQSRVRADLGAADPGPPRRLGADRASLGARPLAARRGRRAPVRRLRASYSGGTGSAAGLPIRGRADAYAALASSTGSGRDRDMATKLEKTTTPGIFRRHAKSCEEGAARARTSSSGATAASSTPRPSARLPRRARRRATATLATGARWRASASGTTSTSGSSPTPGARLADSRRRRRPSTGAPIEQHALPRWRGWNLAEIEPTDVRDLFGGAAPVPARQHVGDQEASRGAVGDVRDRARGRPAALEPGPGSARSARHQPGTNRMTRRAKALTRAELALLLAAIPDRWRALLRVARPHRLRISEAWA